MRGLELGGFFKGGRGMAETRAHELLALLGQLRAQLGGVHAAQFGNVNGDLVAFFPGSHYMPSLTTMMVLMGSLCAARVSASRARSRLTPLIS